MQEPRHVQALRRAMVLCALTVAWNMIVGGGAVATAVATGSLALIGFGLNAVVDSSASAVLVWRFRAEESGHVERAERAERLALRLAGIAFVVIALYLAVQAARSLATSSRSQASAFGLVEAAASAVLLPFLARGKYTLASTAERSGLTVCSPGRGSPSHRPRSSRSCCGASLAGGGQIRWQRLQ